MMLSLTAETIQAYLDDKYPVYYVREGYPDNSIAIRHKTTGRLMFRITQQEFNSHVLEELLDEIRSYERSLGR